MERTWTTNGYGFYDIDLCPYTHDMISFIKKYLPEVYSDMQADMEGTSDDMSNTADYIDFCSNWINNYEDSGYYGFWVLFVMAINDHETDLNIKYVMGAYDHAVMFTERMPWNMTEREKNMELNDLKEIFKKYLDEIHCEAEINRLEIEFRSI